MARANFDASVPASGGGLNSSNIRNNFQALYQGDFKQLRVRAHDTPDMSVMVLGTPADSFYQNV